MAISQLYDVEREVKHLSADERLKIRQARSKPLAEAFKEWSYNHDRKQLVNTH